ncbi:MAG: M13 family metallopeptidase, partial [Christensenella sp.]
MKKITTVTIAILLIASLLFSACSVTQTASTSPGPHGAEGALPTQAATNKEWINADLVGNITADMSLSQKDDYHAAVNQDWLASTKIPDGETQINSGTLNMIEIRKNVLALIADESQDSHEAKLVQKFYNDAIDMETRNKRGIEPIMPEVKEIQNISSMEELTEYYTTDGAKKLSYLPITIFTVPNSKDSQRYEVQIDTPSFSLEDPAEYEKLTEGGALKKQAATLVFTAMLERVGYSKEDAVKMTDQMFEMEKKILVTPESKSDGSASDSQTIPSDELEKASPKFPLAGMLKLYTDAGVKSVSLYDIEGLVHMNDLYTEENLEGFKVLLLYQVLNSSLMYLDQQALDLEAEKQSMLTGSQIKLNVEDVAYKSTNTYLDMAVGKMYVENYVSPETKADITEMVREIVKVFRGRLNNADWMTDETKAKALEKLDTLKFKIAYPDDWAPYAYTELTLDEKNGVWEDFAAINAYRNLTKAKRVSGNVDKELWTSAPQTVNASYSPSSNSIDVYSGILTGVFYNKDNSREENMGSIGTTIAHEITHAFDPKGGKYDKDGNRNNWWTQEDQAAFDKRTAKVSDYFSKFELVP